MSRMFYLSLIYDADGYDRYDIIKSPSLQKIDETVSKYRNRDEVVNDLLKEYHIDKKQGRLSIIYEDLDLKKRQLEEYHQTGFEFKDQICKQLTYAHRIPIMYKNERLMNSAACLIQLKHKLRDPNIQESILNNKVVVSKGKEIIIKTNKRYIFETEEEREFLYKLRKPQEAFECFISRLIHRTGEEDQYFYFRTLSEICNLCIKMKKVTNLNVREENARNALRRNERKMEKVSEDIILSEEAKNNMEEFYTYHDLDEVIRFSPDSNRPIGSESEGKKYEKNNGWK